MMSLDQHRRWSSWSWSHKPHKEVSVLDANEHLESGSGGGNGRHNSTGALTIAAHNEGIQQLQFNSPHKDRRKLWPGQAKLVPLGAKESEVYSYGSEKPNADVLDQAAHCNEDGRTIPHGAALYWGPEKCHSPLASPLLLAKKKKRKKRYMGPERTVVVAPGGILSPTVGIAPPNSSLSNTTRTSSRDGDCRGCNGIFFKKTRPAQGGEEPHLAKW